MDQASKRGPLVSWDGVAISWGGGALEVCVIEFSLGQISTLQFLWGAQMKSFCENLGGPISDLGGIGGHTYIYIYRERELKRGYMSI